MTDFERRVELATDALCSPTSSPETRRKMRRYARRVVRALDAAERERWPAAGPGSSWGEATHEEFLGAMRAVAYYGRNA